MSEWQSKPYVLEVKTGQKISFCACGLTKKPPYCDGSHKAVGKQPYRIVFEEDKKIYACGCQQSKKRPFCDGTHKTLPANVKSAVD